MKRLLLLLIFLLIQTQFFGFETRKDINVRIPQDLRFLKEFTVIYSFPSDEKIISIQPTNYDFAQSSLIISEKAFSNNQFYLKIRSFELSNFTLPPVTVKTVRRGATNEWLTPSFPVEQKPMQALMSNAAPIEDIYTFFDFLPWLIALGILILAGLLGLCIYLIIKRKERMEKPIIAAPEDPYEATLKALLSYKEHGLTAENYSELFQGIWETMRRFIGWVYGINALEMSTTEINAFYKKKSLTETEYREIAVSVNQIFRICDRVKYAKHIPAAEQFTWTISESFEIVRKTKNLLTPVETPVENKDAI